VTDQNFLCSFQFHLAVFTHVSPLSSSCFHVCYWLASAFSALTLLVGRSQEHLACKNCDEVLA